MSTEETFRPSRMAGAELFTTIRDIGHNWIERISDEAELGFKLSQDLIAVHSVPEAIAAYREWMTKEMEARAEDARQLMSDGQRLVDTSARFLTNGWTGVGT